MEALTLVVLAAGMGSRYGGLKQTESFGPSEETLLDYGVYDAVRCGFARLVFVIRRDFADQFEVLVASRYRRFVQVDIVFQSLEDIPSSPVLSGRVKPWGTGHAVWCARHVVNGPFVAINADDFYGRDAFIQLASMLQDSPSTSPALFGLVTYRLDETLSEHGAVARGICSVGPNGLLKAVVEHTGIRQSDVGSGRTFSGAESVSMNCWGLTDAVFPLLEKRLKSFLGKYSESLSAEFFLPAAISDAVGSCEVDVRVFPTAARWFGVTYRDDRPGAEEALRTLVARGEYPTPLTADSFTSRV